MNKNQCVHWVSTHFESRIVFLKIVTRYWWHPDGIPVTSLTLAGSILGIHIVAAANGWNENLIEILGLHPQRVHSYLTYWAIHRNPGHVIGNCLLLVILGPTVERAAGRKPYALMVISLVLVGSVASVILAPDHWTKYVIPVGLSTMTYALIPASSYTATLNLMGFLKRTAHNQGVAMTISASVCALFIWISLANNEGGAVLVGHTSALLGGTIAAGGIALVRSWTQRQSDGMQKGI